MTRSLPAALVAAVFMLPVEARGDLVGILEDAGSAAPFLCSASAVDRHAAGRER